MADSVLGAGEDASAEDHARGWPERAQAKKGIRPTNAARRAHPTGMIDLANTFILFVVIGAAWLGTAALVQKRTRKRRDAEQANGNNAA
jgi:hypothetical protein